MSYKLEKQAFVEGLTGTSHFEVLFLLLSIPLSLFSHRVFKTWLFSEVYDSGGSVRKVASLLLDFIFCVLFPLIVYTTEEFKHSLLVYATLLAVTSTQLVCCRREPFRKAIYNAEVVNRRLSERKKLFVSNYRAYLLLSTSIAILGVDFVIFPRRFAKTEAFGTSLMDVGVGSFVFSSALVSRYAREQRQYVYSPFSTFKSMSPLLVLGVGRMYATWQVDYQTHVSEYGTHWNFFLTLAVIQFVAALSNLPVKYYGLLGLLLSMGYQFALSFLGLESYIISAPRESLLSANREGIFSCIGFTSIFFVGCQLGRQLVFSHGPSQKSEILARKQALRMLLLSVLLYCTVLVLEYLGFRSSRRLANFTYCVGIVALNSFVLACLIALDCILTPIPNTILCAFNRNALVLFLLANILTGVVNMCVPTLYCTPSTALAIVFTYMLLLCSVAVALQYFQLNLKYW